MPKLPLPRTLAILLASVMLLLLPVGIYATEPHGFSSQDAAYLSTLTFFGESTTAHLRAREVLAGGRETTQVWQDESGTKRLGARLLQETVINPRTKEKQTIAQICATEHPRILVLSFGLNGITEFAADTALYKEHYQRLINTVRASSPETRILLQSVYPVTATCTAWSISGKEISDCTRTLNACLAELADASGKDVRYVDTASVITGEDGCLVPSFCEGDDGIHLNADAYRKIICVLCRNAWVEEQDPHLPSATIPSPSERKRHGEVTV